MDTSVPPGQVGGVGVRDIRTLAPSAFLSSTHSTAHLVLSILPAALAAGEDASVQQALAGWKGVGGNDPPVGDDAFRQRSWDEPVCAAVFNALLLRADHSHSIRARLQASVSPDSGAWLHTLPVKALGLALTNREIRVAVALRIGSPLT